MPDTFHTCNIIHAGGDRVRIVAYRRSRRALYSDYDLLVLQQVRGRPPVVIAEVALDEYPRAMGVDGLFAIVLTKMAESRPNAIDEHGVEIPMPEKTPAQWKQTGLTLLAQARECFARAGCFKPDFVEPAEASLFEQLNQGGAKS